MTDNAERVVAVYGIRLGQCGYGFEITERTKMLIKEYGLKAFRYRLDAPNKFGWHDVVVTNVSWNTPQTINSVGSGGHISLDPDPDHELSDRLNKFCSDHGECEAPRWHLYLFSTMMADAFAKEVFTLPDGDTVPGRTYSEGTTGEAPPGYKPSSTGDLF